MPVIFKTSLETKHALKTKKDVSDDGEDAEVFNKFFVNIVPDLKIPANHNCNKDFQKTNYQALINANIIQILP